MVKDFTVPPVVFLSGGNPTTGLANISWRRVPTAPFQPPRPSNSGIPFMSFDMGSATATAPSGRIYVGPLGGGSSASFDDEEPLLDELGIHRDQIWKKIRSILNPYRVNYVLHKDSDLSGHSSLQVLLPFPATCRKNSIRYNPGLDRGIVCLLICGIQHVGWPNWQFRSAYLH